jgi:hypothetical protein
MTPEQDEDLTAMRARVLEKSRLSEINRDEPVPEWGLPVVERRYESSSIARRGEPAALSANEQDWRQSITEHVTAYRRDHGGANPSFRAFALLEGGGDPGQVATWRARVKRHPAIVDPSLEWPQGNAVARPINKNARTMHASVG